MEKKIEPINIALNSSLSQQILENRLRLAPIIETIIFCGRQGLALRGHRDFGNFQLEDPDENDGNFRALLRYKAMGGDETLKHHLENSSKNARYLSPTIQNEVINVCNKLIVQKIVAKITSVKLFSVLADETSDIAGMEQFSLCVRYYDNDIKKIREDFLQCVGVTDLTGKGLANVLMDTLANLHIDGNFMIGQGYDGAAAMSGRLHGAQQYVAEKFDLAIYVHCASHSLNLALSDACELPA
ncbi:zinc finger MYM-type protein 1-like, partial [Physella acuta]